jgi:serine/threonine-protein kinase SRPK3
VILFASQRLEDTVPELAGDEKEAFLDFAVPLLRWLPEERKSPKDLLRHRFWQSFYADRAQFT